MKRLLALRQRHGELVAKLRGITKKAEDEKRNLNAEEIAQFDATETEARGLKAEIEREERLVALETEGRQPAPEDRGAPRPDPAERQPGREANAEPRFASFGEQLAAVRAATLNPHLREPRLIEHRATGMSESVPSDGGFLVQTDFAQTILEKIYNVGVIASRVGRPMPVGPNSNGVAIPYFNETSRANGSRFGGIRGYWTGEGGTLTSSKPGFGKFRLDLDKITALVYVTDEELEDISFLASLLSRIVPEELVFKLEDGIINGSGAGMPTGVLNAAATVSVAKETGQAAATLVAQNIVKMWSRMYAPSRANAVWLINQDIEPQLFTMSVAVGTGGIPVYMPANGLRETPFGLLMGRPVLPVEYCPTLGTVGDIMLIDPTQYFLIDKGGVQSASSIHVQFTTGETAFRFTYRVNGAPWWQSALTPFKGTNTQSPFITLATRA